MAGNKVSPVEIEFMFTDMIGRLNMPYARLGRTDGRTMGDELKALGVCRGNGTGNSLIELNMPKIVKAFTEWNKKYPFPEFLNNATTLTQMVEYILIHELAHALKNQELYKLFPYSPQMQNRLDTEKPDQLPSGEHTTQFNIRAMGLIQHWNAVK